jgi:integrase
MRGHVAKKGNRYYAVIYEGIDQATGRQRHRWYAGGATRKEAEKLLTEMVKRNHDGDYRAPERITLGAYLEERWLPAKRAQLRHSTWDSYRRNVEIHVKPRIGNIPLQRLTPEDLDSFYAGLLVDGRRNGAGGGLSPRSVRIIHGMLRKALADACRKGTLLRNVADLADAPKPSAYASKEMRIWTPAQLRQFLEECLALGRRPDDHGIVFAALEGGPTHPDLFSQIFDRRVAKSTLPRIRLHDLRHTHASILLKAGVPVKVVSERLGHSSPAFTMTVYQHVLPGMQADAAATFSDVVFGE